MVNKKILFISYDGMTDPLGQSQVIPYLSGLTKAGYEFTILSCDKPEKFRTQKNYVQNLIAPFPIQWVSIPYHKRPPVLSSLYDFFKLKRTAKRLHRIHKFDMVHTRPGLPTIVALYLKKKYNIKFLDDVRGFWPDERVDGGMWNLNNPIFKLIYTFFKKHERECFEKADYVTCLTYAARTEIHSWKNIPHQPIPVEVIPCSVDLGLFNPDKLDVHLKENCKKELNIFEDDFIISYLGSIGGWYLTDEMMKFCKRLNDRVLKAKFLFISPNGHDEIAAAAAKYGIAKEKIIVKYARRHEVPVLLSFSNYSIFFIKPCYSKISSSPTKHGEIMAMGIPVITNAGVGDVEEIVTKYKSGYVVKDFSDISFDIVINKMTESDSFDHEAIRNGAKDFYALETAVERYGNVYAKIFEK
jgi:glycosyltransferase involved in cell wall biosynthesis